MSSKIAAGSEIPKIFLPRAGGGMVEVGQPSGLASGRRLQGKHCPICRTYLKTLDGLRPSLA